MSRCRRPRSRRALATVILCSALVTVSAAACFDEDPPAVASQPTSAAAGFVLGDHHPSPSAATALIHPAVRQEVVTANDGATTASALLVDVPEGHPLFRQVRLVGPGRIRADSDIPDGTIVGVLNVSVHTNLGPGDLCDEEFTASAEIIEKTADPNALDYPADLRMLAPGRHDTRFEARVGGTVITYLFDLEPDGRQRAITLVGDSVPGVLRCAPLRTANVIHRVSPDGVQVWEPADTAADRAWDLVLMADDHTDSYTAKLGAGQGLAILQFAPLP